MEWNAELNSCQRINLIQAIFITLYKIDILIPVRAMAYASWRFYFYFLVSFFLDWLGKLTLGNNTINTLVISRLSWISRVYGILNFAYCVKTLGNTYGHARRSLNLYHTSVCFKQGRRSPVGNAIKKDHKHKSPALTIQSSHSIHSEQISLEKDK